MSRPIVLSFSDAPKLTAMGVDTVSGWLRDEQGELILDEDGRPTLVVDELPEPLREEPAPAPNPAPAPALVDLPTSKGGEHGRDSRLGRILADLHVRAKLRPGEVQRAHLPHGLRVDLVLRGGDTKVLLARAGASYPSTTEWSVVLSHWPYDPPLDITPELLDHAGWRCMTAAWPTPVSDPVNGQQAGMFDQSASATGGLRR